MVNFVLNVLPWVCWLAAVAIVIVPVFFVGREQVNRRFGTEELAETPSSISWTARLIAASVLVLLGLVFSAMEIVPTGHRGVVKRFDSPSNRVLNSGLSFVLPFVDSVELYDTRVKKVEFENLEAASAELQDASLTGTLNYRLNPRAIPWLIRNVGTAEDLEQKILVPALENNLKDKLPDYKVLALLGNRNRIGQETTLLMAATFQNYRTDDGLEVVFFTANDNDEEKQKTCELERYVPPVVASLNDLEVEADPLVEGTPAAIGEVAPTPTATPNVEDEFPTTVNTEGIEGRCVQSVFLRNIGFSDQFNVSIEEKQAALQAAEKELYILAQKRIQADQAATEADGRARAIEREAEGQARANDEISASLQGLAGERLIVFEWIRKLPPTMQTMILPAGGGFLLDPSKLLGQVPGTQATPESGQ